MASTPYSFEKKTSASAVLSAASLLLQEVHHFPRLRAYVEAEIQALASEGAGLHHLFFLALPILTHLVLCCPPQSGPPSLQATSTPFSILHLLSLFLYILPDLLHIFVGLCFIVLDDTLPCHLATQLCSPQHGV